MTLGPAFGAPPPSDFNEPHDLHHEPGPIDPAQVQASNEPAATEPAPRPEDQPGDEPRGGIRGWLDKLFGR